jgi:hypothetical protein
MGDLLVMGDTPMPPAGDILHLFLYLFKASTFLHYLFVTGDLNREIPVIIVFRHGRNEKGNFPTVVL